MFLSVIAATLVLLPAAGAEISGDGFLDFEAGNSGDPASVAVLGAGTHGKVGTWSVVDDGTRLTVASGAAHSIDAAVSASFPEAGDHF